MLPAEIENSKNHVTRVDELIKLVGLDGFSDAFPDMLSGGMQSRVQIARAFLLEPEGLALDECFGNLDEITRIRLNMELLRIWGISHPTIIFVTHSIEEAVFLSDRIIVLGQRPAKIVTTIHIKLPRPRETQMMDSPEFRNILSNVRSVLASIPNDPLKEGPFPGGPSTRKGDSL
jgi:NitT/TauT family transport system ATP-binding protein